MNALFECLRLWALDHLNALDDEVWEADEHGVLGSLRSILTGELGCTERADYDDEKWAVLVATGGEAAHREAHRMNGGMRKPLPSRTGLVRPTFRYGMSTRTPDPSFRPAGADVSEPDPSQGVATVAVFVDTERHPSYRDVVSAEHLRQSRLSRWQEQR